MRRAFAVACALMFMTSPIHLEYLPWLRDYSKAPFILGALFLSGLLVRHPLRTSRLFLVAALCAAVTGVGIGFRVDVLICVPPFLLLLLFFLPPEHRPRFRVRLAAAALFLAIFAASSWPILAVLREGGNGAHPALLGLMDPFSSRLGVGGVGYSLGHNYFDMESLALVNAYAQHLDPAAPALIYETPPFEHVATPCAWQLVKTFPADVLLRAYGAVLRVLDELRAGPDHFLPLGVANPALVALYTARLYLERYALGHTRHVAVLVLAVLAARNLRLAFALLGMTLYFAGYSAVQFGSRNVFHLEVIPLWLAGTAANYAWEGACTVLRHGRAAIAPPGASPRALFRPAARLASFAAVASLLVLLPLHGLRWVQDARVLGVFQAYRDAARTGVALKETPLDGGRVCLQGSDGRGRDALPWPTTGQRFAFEFLVAEFANGEQPVPVRVAYTGDCFETDLTWNTVVPPQRPPGGVTQLYFPVYYGSWNEYIPQWTCFRGIELAREDLPRLKGLYRVESPARFPVLLAVTLPPQWQSAPRHQQLTR